MATAIIAGLDLLATAIVIVDRELIVRFVNPAAENLFELSSKNFVENTITEIFEQDRVLGAAISESLFPNTDALGKTVRINGSTFEVIGVFQQSLNR